jgi:hypothetical protein
MLLHLVRLRAAIPRLVERLEVEVRQVGARRPASELPVEHRLLGVSGRTDDLARGVPRSVQARRPARLAEIDRQPGM